MPFKTPRPTYDAKLVADIEEDRDQNFWTEKIFQQIGARTGGLDVVYYRGRENKSYPRPVFEIIDDNVRDFSAAPGRACPCGDFSRTVVCDLHPELAYDTDRHAWVQPGREPEDTRSDAEIEATAGRLTESLSEHFQRLGLPQTNPLYDNPPNVEDAVIQAANPARDPWTGEYIIDPAAVATNTIEVTYEDVRSAAAFFSYETDPGVDGD